MDWVDHYKALVLPKSATAEEIQAAYKRLASIHHPDKHKDENKDKEKSIFQAINEAKQVLTDPGLRRDYDAEYDDRKRKNGAAPADGNVAGKPFATADNPFFARPRGTSSRGNFSKSRSRGANTGPAMWEDFDMEYDERNRMSSYASGVENDAGNPFATADNPFFGRPRGASSRGNFSTLRGRGATKFRSGPRQTSRQDSQAGPSSGPQSNQGETSDRPDHVSLNTARPEKGETWNQARIALVAAETEYIESLTILTQRGNEIDASVKRLDDPDQWSKDQTCAVIRRELGLLHVDLEAYRIATAAFCAISMAKWGILKHPRCLDATRRSQTLLQTNETMKKTNNYIERITRDLDWYQRTDESGSTPKKFFES